MTASRTIMLSLLAALALVCTQPAGAQIFKPRPPEASKGNPGEAFARPPGSPLAPTGPQTQPAPLMGLAAPKGAAPLGQVAEGGAAPYWLKDGIRLTYYSSSASIPATAHYYAPDETGDWVDQNGNRFTQHDNPGPAGHGITQINIACVDGATVAIQTRSYGYSNVNGPLIPLGTVGYAGPVNAIDWWMDPKALQQMQPANSPGMKILRMPWTQNGKTYKTIAFKRDTQDAHSFSIYDEVTGLMLCSNTSSVGPDGRQYLGQNKFMDWRTVHWPWEHTNAPGWLASTNTLRYQGAHRVFIPGSPDLPIGMSATITFTQKTAKWAKMSMQTDTQGTAGMPSVPTSTELICGPSMYAGMWVDPATLRKLRPGQVLDQDKLAGTTVTVGQISGAAVPITETGQLHTIVYTYDLNTGMCVGVVSTNEMLHTRIDLNLAR